MSQPFEEHHGWMVGKVFTLKSDTTNPYSPKLKAGTRVKVVMVSRFGDCGITTDLKKTNGYSTRVMPWQLELLPDVEYKMDGIEIPDFYKGLGFKVARQLSIAEIEQMHNEGKW